ncbi:MAG TPA: hypothetical protein VGG98_07940 [Solirubrobacteraceae bacterium]|jgi:hypothetical protein
MSGRHFSPMLLALLAVLILPASSTAVIHPATVLDGPASDILDVDGTAMAPDGTGGIVYRKVVGGVTHVFAAQFVNGRWGGLVQVDTGNPYGASQPTIAAGAGGRLLVVWVQPRNVSSKGITEYELAGASLQPGATTFGEQATIDPNVTEPYTGDVSAVAPSLAMAPDGAAYVVYRVVSDDCGAGDENNIVENPRCRPGSTDKVVQVRVARFSYLRWSSLGAINRASQIAMRSPTPANAPSIGIDLTGNGVLAWQEPGSDGVARIWVRRLFGLVPGNVLEASPETLGGRPVSSDADSPAVAVSPYGEARIAFRIQGAPGSAVLASELFLNSIASSLGLKASQLTGAAPIPGAAQAGLESPSAAIDSRGGFRLAWTQSGTARELAGTEGTLGTALVAGPAAGRAVTTIDPVGGGTTAWPATAGGLPTVAVRQDFAQGAFQLAQLVGSVPGPVGGLSLGGSGQGDALLGWTQGSAGQVEVVGAFVQAPPAPFNVVTPSGWVRGRRASLSWEASPDAVAGVTYSVYVDGRARLEGLTGLAARLSPAGLGDGTHRVQVLATDVSGQQTMSPERALKVDANPPLVTLRLVDRRRGVHISIRDLASGVKASAIRISFGDGQRARGRDNVSHVYSWAGVYSITAQVRDKVGNHAIVHLRVRVR